MPVSTAPEIARSSVNLLKKCHDMKHTSNPDQDEYPTEGISAIQALMVAHSETRDRKNIWFISRNWSKDGVPY